MNNTPKKPKNSVSLLNNGRFYVLTAWVSISLGVFCLLRITTVSEELRYLRLQQIFGLLAALSWYFILFVSAYSEVVKPKPATIFLLYLRKAFGFAVFYFALLHLILALTHRLDDWSGIMLLPIGFKLSLVFGLLAFTVLLVMATFSVNSIARRFKFKQWKLLKRLGYIAGLGTVLHVWMIGSHAGQTVVQALVFLGLAALFALYALKISRLCRPKVSGLEKTIIAFAIWLLLCSGLVLVKVYIPSFDHDHTKNVETEVIPGGAIHAH